VTGTELKKAIEALCPEVDREVIQDFFARMDEDYFTTFSPEEISKHIALSTKLDADHRIRVRITPHANAAREFSIVIVGFDYLAEFSVFCGLLSAFGLDIREGDIYSFARKAVRASRPLPRKIVDVFRVALRPGEIFDEGKQREFQHELQIEAQLLAEGAIDQVRERLNRFLIERIERMNEPLSGLLSPIEITFNNEVSPEWTVIEAQSDDSFGFLYAISNALSMRGICIHKVKAGRRRFHQFRSAFQGVRGNELWNEHKDNVGCQEEDAAEHRDTVAFELPPYQAPVALADLFLLGRRAGQGL